MDYQAPTIADLGDLQEITAGQSDGNFTDANFPMNTPKKDLTFSN